MVHMLGFEDTVVLFQPSTALRPVPSDSVMKRRSCGATDQIGDNYMQGMCPTRYIFCLSHKSLIFTV